MGGGRNRGRGGAAGLGTRSMAELGRAPRREKRQTRRGGWSGTPECGRPGPGPLGTQPSRKPNVGGGRRDEGPLATIRKDAAAGSLGRTSPGVRLLEAVGRLPPALVCGGDRLQMEEMEGQQARVLADFRGPSGLYDTPLRWHSFRRSGATQVTATAQAKRNRTASAAAPPRNAYSDDD